jgi:hypothetical protein
VLDQWRQQQVPQLRLIGRLVTLLLPLVLAQYAGDPGLERLLDEFFQFFPGSGLRQARLFLIRELAACTARIESFELDDLRRIRITGFRSRTGVPFQPSSAAVARLLSTNPMGWTSRALQNGCGSERELGDEPNRMSAQPVIVAARFAGV